MSNILVLDLHDARTLERRSMAEVRGGMFGGILLAMAEHSRTGTGGDHSGPTLSPIVITKTMDKSSPQLF